MISNLRYTNEPGSCVGHENEENRERVITTFSCHHVNAIVMAPRRKPPARKALARKRKTKAKPRQRATPPAAVRAPSLSGAAAVVKNESKGPSSLTTPTSTPPQPHDKYELAPTGRAKCQHCGKKIALGSRRVGIHEISKRFGDIHRFYHDECYPAKHTLRLDGATPQQLITQQLRERNHGIMALRERQALRESLDLLRSTFAQRLQYAAFCVFSDATLDELVIKMPRTKEEFLAVKGVGPKNYQSFGESFLQVINVFRSLDRKPAAKAAPEDAKVPPKKSRSRLAAVARPEVIDLVGDDDNAVKHRPKRSSSSKNSNTTTNTVHRRQQQAPARTNVDMDDEALVMETLTIEQIVEQKFKHAQENGYVIAVDI
jgi:hypothetical protein